MNKIFAIALGDRGKQYVPAYLQIMKNDGYDAKLTLARALAEGLEYAVYVQTKHVVRDAAMRNRGDPSLLDKLDNLKRVLQDDSTDVEFEEALIGIGVKEDAAKLLSSVLSDVSNFKSLYVSSADIGELLDTMADAVDDIKEEIKNRPR